VRAFADALLEGAGEVIEVGVGDLGERAELQLIAEVDMDVVEHLAEGVRARVVRGAAGSGAARLA
jgi:hypothetical protein